MIGMENGIEEEEEWEMVDYYSCLEDDERGTGKSRLGWVIDRGLSLGKKLVITGIVISSAPILLPPLVVISALGFAFSVPFGFVLGSYACSQKVMSKLLPSPHQTVGGHDEEEVKQSRAFKDGIEMRIELADSEYDDGDGDGDGPTHEQEGLARDWLRDDFWNNGEEYLSEQGMDEKESTNVENPDDYANVASESIKAGDEFEEKKNEKDASSVNVEFQTDERIKGDDNGGSQEQDASSVNVEVQTEEKIIEGEKNGMGKKEKEPLLQEKDDKVEEVIRESKKAQVDLKGKDESKKAQADTKGKEKGRRGKKSHGKRKDPETNKSKSSENINVEGEHLKERSTDELGGVSNVNNREHSEVDGNLLVNDDMEEKILATDAGDVRVNYSESRIGRDDGPEIAVAAAAATPTELESDKHVKEKGGSHSVEGLIGEEKIWEKLDAIRGIVGFKAPKRSSYYEELKVLYVFTGIEPPSTGSQEFANNLSFLMSVIGLK